MKHLLEQIDKYLLVQEKKDMILLSSNPDSDLKDIIEIVRKSTDREKTISMFNEKTREQIQKLIVGGIL